jgi:type I restriction enzyme S subunit
MPPDVAEPYMLHDGDVLFTRSGATVGKCFIYRRDWGPACFAGYLVRAQVDRTKLLPEFLNYFSQSTSYWDQVGASTIQATIQNVSAEKYANLRILVPDLETQAATIARLNDQMRPLADMAGLLRTQLTALDERRGAVITRVLNDLVNQNVAAA